MHSDSTSPFAILFVDFDLAMDRLATAVAARLRAQQEPPPPTTPKTPSKLEAAEARLAATDPKASNYRARKAVVTRLRREAGAL